MGKKRDERRERGPSDGRNKLNEKDGRWELEKKETYRDDSSTQLSDTQS